MMTKYEAKLTALSGVEILNIYTADMTFHDTAALSTGNGRWEIQKRRWEYQADHLSGRLAFLYREGPSFYGKMSIAVQTETKTEYRIYNPTQYTAEVKIQIEPSEKTVSRVEIFPLERAKIVTLRPQEAVTITV